MIFGSMFPNLDKSLVKFMHTLTENSLRDLTDYEGTEEFIEDMYPVADGFNEITIECKVTQDGFQPQLLSKLNFLLGTILNSSWQKIKF